MFPSQDIKEECWFDNYIGVSSRDIKLDIVNINTKVRKYVYYYNKHKEKRDKKYFGKMTDLQNQIECLLHDKKMLERVLEKRSNSYKFIMED